MPIKIGDTITKTCDDVEQGVVADLFKIQPLAKDSGNFGYKVPTLADKAAYIAYEKARGIAICEQATFAKAYTPLAMKIKLMSKCPWLGHAGDRFRIRYSYNEGVGPTNFVSSPLVTTIETWLENTQFLKQYTTPGFGDPYGYGSNGSAQFNLKLEQIDANPSSPIGPTTVRVTGVLIKLGRGYTFLNGMTVTQVKNIGCFSIATVFWTGTYFKPGNPIGLVMSLSFEVMGGFGFVD